MLQGLLPEHSEELDFDNMSLTGVGRRRIREAMVEMCWENDCDGPMCWGFRMGYELISIISTPGPSEEAVSSQTANQAAGLAEASSSRPSLELHCCA